MNTNSIINEIISEENKEIVKNYKKVIIAYIILTVCAVVLYYYVFLFSYSLTPFTILFFVFAFPNLTALVVYFLSNYKSKNYQLFRALVLFNFKTIGYHTNSYFMRIITRVMISFIFTLFLISSGVFILYLKKDIPVPPKSFGFIAVYYSIVFLFIYGVLVLPRLIAFKTRKEEFIYFYWFQYIKSMMVNSPLGMYFSAVLFIIISLSVAFLSVSYTEISILNVTLWRNNFDIGNFLRTDIYGMAITILGLWLATMIIIISDFLKNYIRLYKCYEEYTTHILRQRIIEARYINFIIIGIGNLGKIVGGFLAAEMLKLHKEKYSKHPLALFECFIDRDFEIRVIPRSIIFIEKNISLFEETRLDSESGLTYGFINGNDLNYEINHVQNISSTFAVFSINGDGGYLPMLDLADFSTAKIIMNTSSDPDLGFKLKMLVDTQIKTPVKPIIITTVEDSGTYSFLEGNNDVTIYPLHAGMTEGNSIATRLFAMFLKTNKGTGVLNNKTKLLIAGNGKTLYYTLFSFLNIMQQFYKIDEIRQFVQSNLIIVTNDKEVLSESRSYKEDESFSSRKYWIIKILNNAIFKIRIINHNPAGYHGLYNAMEWIKNDFGLLDTDLKKSDFLFLLSTKVNHDAIRICQHIKQISDVYGLESTGVLASVTLDVFQLIHEQLSSFKQLDKFLHKNPGFPEDLNDVILKKNLIIGSQIISISECFRENDYFDNRKSHYQKQDNQNQDFISGELALCINDEPGIFCQILARLGGLTEPVIQKRRKLIPSFYNNYTYTLNTSIENLENTFIFRGDACIERLDDQHSTGMIIDSFKSNGSSDFNVNVAKLINELFSDRLKNEQCCTYNTRCPVSNSSNNHCSNLMSQPKAPPTSFATIKILADAENVSGSLAVMLSDFLMTGKNLDYYETADQQKTDIIYENCVSCENIGKAVTRLYLNIKKKSENQPVSNNKTRERQLLEKRNILAIKIKIISNDKNQWNNYCKNLNIYLNRISSREFVLYKPDDKKHEIIIRDKFLVGNIITYVDQQM